MEASYTSDYDQLLALFNWLPFICGWYTLLHLLLQFYNSKQDRACTISLEPYKSCVIFFPVELLTRFLCPWLPCIEIIPPRKLIKCLYSQTHPWLVLMMVHYFSFLMMSSSPTCLGIIPASAGGSIGDEEGQEVGQEVSEEEESDSAELSM
jgi:hypothetical protein